MTQAATTEKLLTVAEAAEYLAVKPITIRAMIRAGLLPRVYVGIKRRNYRLTLSSVQAYIQNAQEFERPVRQARRRRSA